MASLIIVPGPQIFLKAETSVFAYQQQLIGLQAELKCLVIKEFSEFIALWK